MTTSEIIRMIERLPESELGHGYAGIAFMHKGKHWAIWSNGEVDIDGEPQRFQLISWLWLSRWRIGRAVRKRLKELNAAKGGGG